ncbi:MAG: universal stress protein [Hyphomicrobiaceae bacterium]
MIERIAHPTDFSPKGDAAFCHALRLAVEFRCQLDLLHVRYVDDPDNWEWFPQVRETLSRWALLAEGAKVGDIKARLGVIIRKIMIVHFDPVVGISDYLSTHRPDLVVLATQGETGLTRFLSGSVSEDIAQQTRIPTLFLGPNTHPFVDLQSGALKLDNLVVPLARNPSPRRALHTLKVLLEPLAPHIHAIHIGDIAPWILDKVGEPLNVSIMQGPVVETILEAARTSDLIAMPTDGRHGILDALRGSTTERVLRQANRPLLALPA